MTALSTTPEVETGSARVTAPSATRPPSRPPRGGGGPGTAPANGPAGAPIRSRGSPSPKRPTHRWWTAKRLLDRPPWVDLLLAAVAAVVSVTSLAGRLPQFVETDEGFVGFTPPDLLGVMLLLGSTLPIAVRRTTPWSALAASTACTCLYLQAGYPPAPVPYGMVLAFYAIASRQRPARSLLAGAACLASLLAVELVGRVPLPDDDLLAYLLSIGVIWGLGYGIQLNRLQAALIAQRGEQVAQAHAATARLAVERERAQIARGLHDVVSHHVSVIVAQASAVQRTRADGADPLRAALASIESTGREAMVAMRRMLGVLQPELGDDVKASPPTLAQLPDLEARMRGAGLTVDVRRSGPARRLPSRVDTVAYRIIDEALTNALKHTRDAQILVVIGYEPTCLRIEIHDDNETVTEPSPAGHGLVGILQRVTQLGGHLSVGRCPDRGFEVVALLPLDGG